jgi:regulator of protease activity HflC (stomatin/prohibitin superfamily)
MAKPESLMEQIKEAAATQQAKKLFAEPIQGHVSLGRSLRFVLWLMPTLAAALYLFVFSRYAVHVALIAEVLMAIFLMILVAGIRVAAQWEKGIVLRLGKFEAIKGPGVIYIIPVLDYVRFVDTRTLVLNIPKQKVITKDNVPAEIDGAVFFLIADVERAVIKIQDYQFAIAQYAQASLRDVIGGLSLDELLSEREQIQLHIQKIVEERIKEWGLHVDTIRLLDIELPEDLKKMMSRQASAEREKRATITKAEGDKLAAVNLAEAARIMHESPGAMQLRTLQTLDGLGPTSSNTVVVFPAEFSEMVKSISNALKTKDTAPPPA